MTAIGDLYRKNKILFILVLFFLIVITVGAILIVMFFAILILKNKDEIKRRVKVEKVLGRDKTQKLIKINREYIKLDKKEGADVDQLNIKNEKAIMEVVGEDNVDDIMRDIRLLGS